MFSKGHSLRQLQAAPYIVTNLMLLWSINRQRYSWKLLRKHSWQAQRTSESLLVARKSPKLSILRGTFFASIHLSELILSSSACPAAEQFSAMQVFEYLLQHGADPNIKPTKVEQEASLRLKTLHVQIIMMQNCSIIKGGTFNDWIDSSSHKQTACPETNCQINCSEDILCAAGILDRYFGPCSEAGTISSSQIAMPIGVCCSWKWFWKRSLFAPLPRAACLWHSNLLRTLSPR